MFQGAKVLPTFSIDAQVLALADALPALVWVTTPEGVVEYANRHWRDYTGVDLGRIGHEEFIVSQMVHPDDGPRIDARWRAVRLTGEPFELEYRLLRVDGAYRWFFGRALPVRDGTGLIHWVGVATEIHEQKLASERQQAIAEQLQAALMQRRLPSHAELAFDAVYAPSDVAARVGGDWYDVFVRPDGTVAFSVGDVCGHGVEAAALMGKNRHSIAMALLHDDAPSEVLSRLNRLLMLDDSAMTTALCGIIDPRTRVIVYAGAGHPAPLLTGSTGGTRLLPTEGIPLGIETEAHFEQFEAQAERGSIFFAHTDGLLESKRDLLEGERTLLHELTACVSRHEEQPAQAICRAILGDVETVDDIAALSIRFL